jgi:hypothetical protein
MTAGIALQRGGMPHATVPADQATPADSQTRRRSAPRLEVLSWRGQLTTAPGLLWLLDTVLQFQPYMFTTDFPNQLIKPGRSRQPQLGQFT